MPGDDQQRTPPPGAQPNGPDYGYHGPGWSPFGTHPYSAPHPFGAMPFPGFPFCAMPDFTFPFAGMPHPAGSPAAGPHGAPGYPPGAASFEAMRQFFMSRAEFWSHTLQMMSHAVADAARVAAEAGRACAMMGAQGENFFAPPGGPYAPPPPADIDVDKLREGLKGMDPEQSARVLYAVQMMQAMDAMRKSSASDSTGKAKDAW
jgi:hypothetical protein